MTWEDGLYDVVVCGGGPIGLLIGYGLQRCGISACVIERLEKANMPMYGRACSLYARTIELLDSYDLLEEMVQSAFICRGDFTHNQGQRVTTRGWHSLLNTAHGTFANFILSLRMKHSEDVFTSAFEKLGGDLAAGWEVTDFSIGPPDLSTHRVSIQAKHLSSGQSKTINAKHIVGADGGRSIIRRVANINMPSTGTPYHWVRIDGLIETDMPDANLGLGAIESPTHGNVLWVRIDHGRTRIGYSLNPTLIAKYGEHLTQEQAVYEAQQAMLPYSCNFAEVDWYTTYSIRQALCDTFVSHDGAVIMAGDAAHLHSSGAAQGMNTGVHDATNLAWKLAGVVKGHFVPEVLDTYSLERQPTAQKLIILDKQISSLVSGKVPDDFIKPITGQSVADPNALLSRVVEESIQFNIGLGVSYSPNLLNKEARAGMVTPGTRAPDKLLHAPGSVVPVRLQHITRNTGIFNILVFVGEPLLSQPHIKAFREYLDDRSQMRFYPPELFRFLTIIVGNKAEGEASLGCKRFGKIWFDQDTGCHYAYGLSPERGGVVVVRPDGVCGFAIPLMEGHLLDEYFGAVLVRTENKRAANKAVKLCVNGNLKL